MKRVRKTTSSFGVFGRMLLWFCACASIATAQQRSALPEGLPAGFKAYESPIYHVYTDVDLDMAREAVIRMNKIAVAYHDRTAAFSGAIRGKLPQITCLLPDGTKLIGRFTLHGERIGQVQVDTTAPPAKKGK